MFRKLALLTLVFSFIVSAQAFAYTESDLERGDAYHAQRSWRLAANEYARLIDEGTENEKLAREVRFKWADSILRGKDEAQREKAEKLLREIYEGKDADRWQAEAALTLAEHFIERDRYGKQQDIRAWLDTVRDYWAGSSEIDLARQKFIESSFIYADFVTGYWGWYSNMIKPVRLGRGEVTIPPNGQPQNIGLRVLYEEILKVAKSDEDKARATYGLAMSHLHGGGGEESREKAMEYFETVIERYGKSEWADDAWWQAANSHESRGDYVRAVDLYKAYLREYRRGESQWVDDARHRIENITGPQLNVSVGNTFVPGSQVRFNVNWRNVTDAEFTLYKLDLARELGLKRNNDGISGYQELIRERIVETGRVRSLPVHKQWRMKLQNEGKHKQYGENKGLAEWRGADKTNEGAGVLPTGAYLLMVTAGGKTAYDLVLVTDLALVSKVSDGMALFLAMDAKTGEPVANATVKYVYSYYQHNHGTRWLEGQGRTNAEGLFTPELQTDDRNRRNYRQHSLFAAATATGDAQAFVQNNYYHNSYNNKGEWWLYAYTDRPAYRPNEEVGFKGIVRRPQGGLFTNPADMRVKVRIYDGQNNQVHEQDYTLNDYGSFSGTLTLDDKAVLGQYRMQVFTADTNSHLANAQLFRLEEYKLPEFVVNVAPKPKESEDGAQAAPGHRLGDTLTVEVDAQYYFGGAVSEADVEYLVYQKPYTHRYQPVKPYPWYYEDMRHNYYRGYGHGQLVTQQKIKTDTDGKASFTIETPENSTSDLEYHVEVRVVDQSRREIRGTADIKVTKTAYFAYLEARQQLYRPGDKARVLIKTMTANEAPYPVEGKVTVKRNWWRDPVHKDGRVVQQGGYGGEELFTKFVKTNDRGETVFEFEPERNGYYTVAFTGFDNGREVTSQVNVFVCDDTAVNIGYKYSGLQIITEKDTYAPGETARAMIVSDKPDTWVLFTLESDELYSYQMLHLEGSVKLVEVPITENHTPNVFMHAVSGDHYQLKQTNLQLIVPPDGKFLNVKITSDKEVYQPQEECVFDIEITDSDGRPVQGEVSLGLVDASVYYIQGEYAPDIRKFFYGDKKPQNVRTQASFYQRQYVDLVKDKDGNILTKQDAQRRADMRQNEQLGDDKDYAQNKEYRSRETGAADAVASRSMLAQSAAEPAMELSEGMAVGRMEAKKSARMVGGKGEVADEEAPGGGAGDEPADVRQDFRSTVLWQPSVRTDRTGRARVKVTFPDSLTTWRMTARAATKDTSVGNVTHEVKSNKELMVRLQAPRFFTEKDLVAVSALIDNLSDKDITLTPRIKVEGGIEVTGLYSDGKFVKGELGPVTVPAKGQSRVDWAVSAQEAGEASIMVWAKGGGLSDAMQKTYPVIPHGIEKFIAESLVLKGEGAMEKELVIDIPRERIKASTGLRLTLSPSLAANMLDALPYLADYPYGCVEQTMSRFLPAVVVGKTMRELGISKRDADTYIANVLEKRGDPEGAPGRRTDATVGKLDAMVDAGLTRLYDFQHDDGGWGWWKTGSSDRFMSAYVVWGLALSRAAGIDVRSDVMNRAVRYLQEELVEEEDNPDMLAWMLHALAEARASSDFEDRQRDRLWRMRDSLNPYTRALFALSEHTRGNADRARILAQNVVNGVDEDAENATAHWGESGVHYRWSEGGVEATAFVIKALSNMDAGSRYLDPAVKWLTLNRRGGRWKNTRDTAIAILGLADYLKATRELAPDYSFEVFVNGKKLRDGRLTADNVFSFDRILDVPRDLIRDGGNTVKVKINGTGAMYVAAHAKFFSLEEPITKAGNEIFVTRKYFIKSVKETLMKGMTEDWKPLEDGDAVKSGDRIRVDITLEAKNHYEYLVAEDYKPAGLEAVELNSGAGHAITLDRDGRETSRRTPLYREFRDERAAFFISKLEQGSHLIRYELRAEIPGVFHAMPNQAHAMYVPEIRANSDEMRITVND